MTIAYWCVLVAIFLPYVWFGVANAKGGKERSNHYPRDFVARAEGTAKRALGAHLNTFETNPGFYAAVIIAHLAHAPQGRIDALAIAYVVVRLAYGLFYIGDKAAARSATWFLSLVCIVGLFVISA